MTDSLRDRIEQHALEWAQARWSDIPWAQSTEPTLSILIDAIMVEVEKDQEQDRERLLRMADTLRQIGTLINKGASHPIETPLMLEKLAMSLEELGGEQVPTGTSTPDGPKPAAPICRHCGHPDASHTQVDCQAELSDG